MEMKLQEAEEASNYWRASLRLVEQRAVEASEQAQQNEARASVQEQRSVELERYLSEASKVMESEAESEEALQALETIQVI